MWIPAVETSQAQHQEPRHPAWTCPLSSHTQARRPTGGMKGEAAGLQATATNPRRCGSLILGAPQLGQAVTPDTVNHHHGDSTSSGTPQTQAHHIPSHCGSAIRGSPVRGVPGAQVNHAQDAAGLHVLCPLCGIFQIWREGPRVHMTALLSFNRQPLPPGAAFALASTRCCSDKALLCVSSLPQPGCRVLGQAPSPVDARGALWRQSQQLLQPWGPWGAPRSGSFQGSSVSACSNCVS